MMTSEMQARPWPMAPRNKDLFGREMNLLHKTMQDDYPHKELVKAWKLENKWARLLEKQLNRANRDNGILGSEL